MDITFNINREVWVRLTTLGKAIVCEKYGVGFYEQHIEPKEDENGYIPYQLWALMQDFGSHLSDPVLPFDTNIIIPGVKRR